MRWILICGTVMLTLISVPCLAQNNQTEAITITTYYPAPFGVYKNPQLVGLTSAQVPDCTSDKENCLGTMFFNDTDKQLYLFGEEGFKPVYAGSSNLKFDSGHFYSPDECEATVSWGGQLCDYFGWYGWVTFNKPFTKPPQVILVQEMNPDMDHSPCTDNMTDGIAIYAENINTTGFHVEAAGGPNGYSTCAVDGRRARVQVGWLAIGE